MNGEYCCKDRLCIFECEAAMAEERLHESPVTVVELCVVHFQGRDLRR